MSITTQMPKAEVGAMPFSFTDAAALAVWSSALRPPKLALDDRITGEPAKVDH
jgi:hypothetical protein